MSYQPLEACVWATNALTDPDLIFAFESDVFLENKQKAVDAMKRVNLGEPLPADRFPNEMHVISQYKEIKRLPDICLAGGFWVVSGRLAEVLSGFDLGQTGLHPVKLFHHDRKTPFGGEYFTLAFGETKDTFVPEESPEASKAPFKKGNIWKPSLGNEDDGLALSSEALESVDLWMEKSIVHCFFLSNSLLQALKAEKLSQYLQPYRCRVVTSQH